MPVNTFQDTSSSLGLQTQADYKPISKTELEQAYQQYSGEGLKFGQVKGKSDTALYARATDVVLRWWKAQKAQKDAKANNPVGNSATGGANGSGGVSGGNSSGAGIYGNLTGSSPYGGSGSGPLLPDTAFKPGPADNSVLPPILSQGEIAQQQANAKTAKANVGVTSDTTRPLTAVQARQIMNNMGVPSNWHPPAYALNSQAALQGWVHRASAQQNLILAKGQQPILDTATTSAIIRSMNAPIALSSIPRSARVNVVTLRNYITRTQRSLAILRQQQYAQTNSYNPITSSQAAIQRRTGGF